MRGSLPMLVVFVLGCGPGSPSLDDATTETSGCEPFTGTVPPLGPPDTCAGYLGDPPPTGDEVEVSIINHRDEAILLLDQRSGCQHAAQWFQLDGEFQGRAVWLPTSSCELEWPSCRVYTDDPPDCSLCETLHPPIYIEPGGRHVTSWTTVVALDTELPAECTNTGESHPCWAPNALPPGNYQLRAVAGLASDCASSDCTCVVDANGSCTAPDWPSEANLEASLEWSSECDRIVLAFER